MTVLTCCHGFSLKWSQYTVPTEPSLVLKIAGQVLVFLLQGRGLDDKLVYCFLFRLGRNDEIH